VHVMRPLGATGVGAVTFSSLLVHQSLGRLLGLGLGLLPHDSLLACSLSPLADHHEFLALQDDLLPHAPSADELVDKAEVLIDPLANQAPDAPPASLPPLLVQEFPSFLDQPLVQETLDQPSIKGEEKEAVSEEEVVEASEEEDEEWTSLGLGLRVGEEAKPEAVTVGLGEESANGEAEGSGIGALTFAEEEEWPSIKGEEKEAVSEEEVEASEDEDEDEEWPSLGLGLSVGEEAKPEAVIVGLGEESASGEAEGSGLGALTFAEEEEWPSIKGEEKEASSDLLRQDQSVPHLEMDSQSLLKAHSPQEVEQTVPSSPINPMNQSQTSRIELKAMNVKQLKQYCRELRLSGYSALRKDGLIRLIEISGGLSN